MTGRIKIRRSNYLNLVPFTHSFAMLQVQESGKMFEGRGEKFFRKVRILLAEALFCHNRSGSMKRAHHLTVYFLFMLLAQPAGLFGQQSTTVPGFGPVVSSTVPGWWHSNYGLIAFGNDGSDVRFAFSADLGDWLATDGVGVYSRIYGRVIGDGVVNDGFRWVASENFGWVGIAEPRGSTNGFLWTERAGWVNVVPDPADGNPWVYIGILETWGKFADDRSFYSVDYRKLSPGSVPNTYNSEIFGLVTVDPAKPGWLVSETFGDLWSIRGQNAKFFWSSLREEWLGVDANGTIWSPSAGRLPKPAPAQPTAGGGAPADFDINNVVWLHTDVSDWTVTADLKSVDFNGGLICLDYELSNRWPSIVVRVTVNANPWIITKINGRYYAGTWEYFRPGQQCKSKNVVAGDHVKIAPMNGNWRPQSGQVVGMMVSSLARGGQRTSVAERSNIVWFEWP